VAEIAVGLIKKGGGVGATAHFICPSDRPQKTSGRKGEKKEEKGEGVTLTRNCVQKLQKPSSMLVGGEKEGGEVEGHGVEAMKSSRVWGKKKGQEISLIITQSMGEKGKKKKMAASRPGPCRRTLVYPPQGVGGGAFSWAKATWPLREGEEAALNLNCILEVGPGKKKGGKRNGELFWVFSMAVRSTPP